MLKSYLILAWRNLMRNRTLSLINLIGLSLSVAFCLLLFYHIRFEQSFDTFHQKKDRLFRCEMTGLGDDAKAKPAGGLFSMLTGDNDRKNNLGFPLVVGPDMKRVLPEVAGFTRFRDQDDELVRVGRQVYKETQVIFGEDNFFSNLSFTLLKGDPRTALSGPENVVLSETVAKKYFGDRDPMGQTISLVNDENRLFRVTGVAADAPANSSIRYGFVLPIEAEPGYLESISEGFNRMNDRLLIELRPGTDRAAFEGKMNAWVKVYMKPSMDTTWNKLASAETRDAFRFSLRPLADCHYNASGGWGHYTDARAIYQLLCIVVVILLLASLNYVLITVSNAAARSQEVGVRKVMGAGRGSIILQSWVETQLIAGIAVGVGLVLAYTGLPLLRTAIGSGISYSDLSLKEMLVAALVLVVALGVLAGYYPALLISRLKAVSIMKSFSSVRINPRFSRLLVVVQFTCCIVLIMAAFVIDRQMGYILHKDLGFDKDQVLIIHNPSWDADFTSRTRGRLYAFARTQPSVLAYSGMIGGLTGANNTNGWQLNGKQEWMKQISVDYNYFELLGLKIVQGRSFSPAFPGDTVKSVRACVVNESLFRMLGKDVQLGVYIKSLRGTIIGVVKDYNFESLSKKIEPEQHRLASWYESEFLFKVKAGQMPAVIAAFETEWKTVTNNYPFEYTFLDAAIAQMYESDMRWQRAMRAASIFAILIACMGLFGLSAIAAVNRTKEIGIRKVLGASVRDLVSTLASGFLTMVSLSIVIAVPLAWWMMNKWLEDFAYRITIRWWMFVVVGLTAVAIALMTVSFQVFKAARANPVDSLRAE